MRITELFNAKAIALSTTFCPKKWTLNERRNGIVNYVMGLCFVTEGAIPYAAAGRDPEPPQKDPHRRGVNRVQQKPLQLQRLF